MSQKHNQPQASKDQKAPQGAQEGESQAKGPASDQKPAEPPKSAKPAAVKIPKHLEGSGWKVVELKEPPRILYGLMPCGGMNYRAVRLELLPDGSVRTMALPDNLKQIAVDRLIDLLMMEN
jgi:hypothetical protein